MKPFESYTQLKEEAIEEAIKTYRNRCGHKGYTLVKSQSGLITAEQNGEYEGDPEIKINHNDHIQDAKTNNYVKIDKYIRDKLKKKQADYLVRYEKVGGI